MLEIIPFSVWETKAESMLTIEVNRDIIRDIYLTPAGIQLMHDVCMPAHVFGKTWNVTIIDYALPLDSVGVVEAAGGTLSEDYYTEDGHGVAKFSGTGVDSVQLAYEFMYSESGIKLYSIDK